MENAFFTFMQDFGAAAVFALIAIENIFPPIPSELILPLAGFFAQQEAFSIPAAILAATAGSVLGAYILYGIGRIISEDRLEHFFSNKFMRRLGFKPDDVIHAISWFDTKGQLTVLVCRCIPVVRSLISIPAGTAKLNIIKFTLYTLIGSAIWNSVLIYLGYGAGSAWAHVSQEAEWVSEIVKIVLVVIVLLACWFWYVKRIKPQNKKSV